MYIGSPLKANAKSPKVLQPGKRSFNDPTMATKPFIRFNSTPGNARNYPARNEVPSASRIVIALIGMNFGRTKSRMSNFFCNWRYQIDRGSHSDGIMCIRRRDCCRERNSLLIDHDVVFAAVFPAIRWIRAEDFAPFLAGTVEPSTAALSRDSRSRSFNFVNAAFHTASHIPSSCHSTRRRQHVTPEGNPTPRGSIRQGIADLRTNIIPASAIRSSLHGRPPLRDVRRFGMSGSTVAQTLSGTRSIPFSNTCLRD